MLKFCIWLCHDIALRDNTCMREDVLMAKEYSPIWWVLIWPIISYVCMYRDFSRKAKGLVLRWGRPQFMNLHLVRSCTQRSYTLFIYFENLDFPHLIYYLESFLYNIRTYACVMYLCNVCIVCLKRSCWNDRLHYFIMDEKCLTPIKSWVH